MQQGQQQQAAQTPEQQQAAAEAAQQRQQQQEEMKNQILNQILDQSSRARLATIAAAKPEKAQQIEMLLCQMAQRGQIQGKLKESQLTQILEQIADKKTTKVKYDRRRNALDSDDEDEEDY